MDGLQQKVKRRRKTVDQSMDSLFLELWAEKITELRGERKNSHIYIEMADTMSTTGHNMRPLDIKYKIANFTKKYRECKAKMGTGSSPATWQYYEDVHKIIGGHSINKVDEHVVESGIDCQTINWAFNDPPSPTSCMLPSPLPLPSAPPSPTSCMTSSSVPLSSAPPSPYPSVSSSASKNKKNNPLMQFTQTFSDFVEEQKACNAKTLEIEEERTVVLRSISESTTKMAESTTKLVEDMGKFLKFLQNKN